VEGADCVHEFSKKSDSLPYLTLADPSQLEPARANPSRPEPALTLHCPFKNPPSDKEQVMFTVHILCNV
jgi:hypothetical protein